MGQLAASAEPAVDLQGAEKARASFKKRECLLISTGVVVNREEDTILSMSHDNLQVVSGMQTHILLPSCGHKSIGRGISKSAV